VANLDLREVKITRIVTSTLFLVLLGQNMPRAKPIPDLTPEQVSRFWSKVNQGEPDQCWEWQGGTWPNGYPYFSINGRMMVATRVSVFLDGNQPGSLFVCHTCDNPKCVNPAHLFLGTQKDNMHDCHLKNRTASREKHGRRKLTEEQVIEIRKSEGTCRSIAKKFLVSAATICLIRNNKKWINPDVSEVHQ
jgi:hypothetical protein